jgi:hypothetical protein
MLRHLMRFDKAIPDAPAATLPVLRLDIITDDDARLMTEAAAISNPT